MLQGKIDATLVSPDNLFEAEQNNLKLSILSDLKDLGIYTSASDLSARRDFLKNQRQKARAFMMAYCEAIWLGKANKNVALASLRKHMREQDPRRLDTLYKNYVVDALPIKPYPMEDALQGELENLAASVAELHGKKSADFIDKSLLSELEREGFFASLQANTANKIVEQRTAVKRLTAIYTAIVVESLDKLTESSKNKASCREATRGVLPNIPPRFRRAGRPGRWSSERKR